MKRYQQAPLAACWIALLMMTGPASALECPDIQRPLPSPTGLIPGYEEPRPPYEWAGAFESCPVTLPSARTGARLYGMLHFPPGIERPALRRPGIVIGPGSLQGVQANYQWLARFLAANGYIALTVDPQGVGYSETTALQGAGRPGLQNIPFQQLGNYIDALRSGLNFLLSMANPVKTWTRQWGFGLAGHSLSARAASVLQANDSRVDAIAAMDNLSSNREGDAGVLIGGGLFGALAGGEIALTNTPNPPRVPAIALASDGATLGDPFRSDPESKKAGYLHWRAAGVPTMVVVFRGSEHSDFARKPDESRTLHERSARYVRAWFDRYLRDRQRTAAPDTLLADAIAGQTRADFLSRIFNSAAFFPSRDIDCPDLLERPCPTSARADSANQ